MFSVLEVVHFLFVLYVQELNDTHPAPHYIESQLLIYCTSAIDVADNAFAGVSLCFQPICVLH